MDARTCYSRHFGVKHNLRAVALCVVLATFLPASDAEAYAIFIHEQLTDRALPDGSWLVSPQRIDGASAASLTRFRRWIYDQIARHPDAAIRDRFMARYPKPETFTALAFREFVSFNRSPKRRIWGIDRSRGGRGLSARDLLVASSGAPDRDGRNRDRVEYDSKTGRPVKGSDGNPIPDDPSILNMGKAIGLSSQGHAHYGLPRVELSDDPEVLKTEPERFAVKAGYPDGPILALAREMAQLHTDLALLANIWGGNGHRYLTVSFCGHAFHYIQDVGNQIHTIQVGLYDFFKAAKLQYWWRAFVTSGGYLAPLKKFTSVGIDILSNHHILIESLAAKRFKEAVGGQKTNASIARAVDAMGGDDAAFSAALDAALATGQKTFAATITDTLITASSPEGAKTYELAAQAACGRLSNYGVRLKDDTEGGQLDPDTLVCDTTTLDELYTLQAASLVRVTTALRRFDRELAAAAAHPDKEAHAHEILSRFVTARLDLLDAADKRREAYKANPPADAGDTLTSAGWPIAQAVIFFLIIFYIRRKLAPLPQ